MTPAPMTEREVQRQLDDMMVRLGSVRGAVLLTNDGLVVASSSRFGREDSEHLSALVAGVQGLARGACRRFGGGELMQTLIEMDTFLVFMVPAGDRSCVALVGLPQSDVGAIAYEMTEFAERLAERPPATARLSGSSPR
ncbi:roadblock/LC7 domain-containing protein [Actinomadura darangshiensis]|uniref:Roadblock/LC7 domain-containing protein n=1 Tax=Actinomadura darangshiensis TaxID=705336 RepID=A0A4V2YTX7_9ACTN|nr:roadblock/LC7 domain-containing protein [Actinomadura darangshiensis]TDD75357.1 roadblock/LC7 domain-containing protein [Actinomadura darangshiensis]